MSILNIGKSALAAAQVGINTTGHNIANAATPGYSRQEVVQAASASQKYGFGFVGQGVQIDGVKRVYSEILTTQMVKSQASASATATYNTEMKALDNMLSDASAGLNPAMSDFFSSMQALSASPSDTATRQSMLSYAQSLASRFQSTANRLNEIRQGVNTQLTTSIGLVNNYAQQIASLNQSIESAVNASGQIPNDLMDQRDQVILELSKQIQTTVVPQGEGSYNVFIGSGLPLVIGKDTMSLTPVNSPTDPSRIEVAYRSNDKVTELGLASLPGGEIGGLLQFRAESLDPAQNQVGQLAAVLAESYNGLFRAGFDKDGNLGGNLFTISSPVVTANSGNKGTAEVTATILDASKLTSSDYRIQYDGSNYKITRLSDNFVTSTSSLPLTLDGLKFDFKPPSTALNSVTNDDYLVMPTRNIATQMKVAITDPNKLAVGGPAVNAGDWLVNTGNAVVSSITASSAYAASPITNFDLAFSGAAPTNFSFTGAQALQPFTVTTPDGVTTSYAAGASAPYGDGAKISISGLSFTISGTPNNGDGFTFAASSFIGPSDNRNGLLLVGLQSDKTMAGNKSFSDAFGQMVNSIGNKTRELNVLNKAESQILEQATAAVQAESGVNLDEEATNLIRYQQAYQAAGKMMQIGAQLFEVLLSIGQ